MITKMGYARPTPPNALVTDDDLEMARRHLATAEARVKNQRMSMALLAVRRKPLGQAREMLTLLEDTLRAHRVHLAQLEAFATRYEAVRQRVGERAGWRETVERRRQQGS